MLDTIYSCVAHLVIINLIILCYSFLTRTTGYKHLVQINIIYFAFYCSTFIPAQIEFLEEFVGGTWNWEGKLISLFIIILTYFFFSDKSKFFLPKNLKINTRYLVLVLVVAVIYNSWIFFVSELSNFDLDTFFFQLLMPSLSEELMFRSIALGLLANYIFPEKKSAWFNIIVISILFGLSHSLFITDELEISFTIDA